MNKVMTRTGRHPGARPPGRRDSRRPGGAPPRAPGTGTPARPPGGSPPRAAHGSSSPAEGTRAPSGPAVGVPARSRPATGVAAPSEPTTGVQVSPRTPARPAPATAARETARRPVPGPRPTDVFAERLLAVLSGARPVHCMLRHTAGRAYDELVRLAERGPLRTRGARPVVRDIGYYVARPDALEAFARIGAGDQLRAMAFRLEQGPDLRWRCTAIELGGPRGPHGAD
ncbi:Rv3235 family protein [Streptomyces aureus]|uniref:Rv3235 family protein n=1 Tax=Streptomyces aureus TaxID=193461 RepID=UPI003688B41D